MTNLNLPASFIEWLGNNKLCPCRLDADFKVIYKPGAPLYNIIYERYGCVEGACAVWAGACGLNPMNFHNGLLVVHTPADV